MTRRIEMSSDDTRAAADGIAALLLIRSLLASLPATARRKAVKRALDELDAAAPTGLAARKARRLLVGTLAGRPTGGERRVELYLGLKRPGP
jgi:hypothetical protein